MNEYRRFFFPLEKIDAVPFPTEPVLQMNRHLLEHWIEQFDQKSERQSIEPTYLSKIVLKAKLEGRQLTSGQGFFTFSPHTGGTAAIPLNPLSLAVSSLRWSDDTEAVFFCDPDGLYRLRIPAQTDSYSYDQLQFHWSLQSRKDYRNGVMFDIALPACISIELHLVIPKSLVLSASTGIVHPDESNTASNFRTWRVMLGRHSNTTLTIIPDKTLSPPRQKSAIRQIITYTVSPQGLETTTRISFDTVDTRPDELLLELELPLRPIEAKYGEHEVQWTRVPASPGKTGVRVDLSPFAQEEKPQELLLRALGPLLENQRWILPRIRVTSSDIFWVYTRCGVWINSPLRARNLICNQAVQVPPLASTEIHWAERELYVYEFFQDDAQIELEVVHSIPHITVNSVAQIVWDSNEIRGTVYLDCSLAEGERFTLNFPVSEHWVIDSVTSYPPPSVLSAENDPIFSAGVLEDTESPTRQTLSVQLNRPLRPHTPITLQLSCRFINSTQNQFRLAELSPLVMSHRHGESHYIAVQPDLTFFNLQTSVDASSFGISPLRMLGDHSIPLRGDIFPLDSKMQDIRLNFERTSPHFSAAIAGNVYIDNGAMTLTYRIQCVPDSSIDRVHVHFTPFDGDNPQWNWSLVSTPDSSRLLRTRKLSLDELKESLPFFETQNRSEDWEHGEIWEIRFDGLQSAPFELVAESFIPLADSMPIPFASLPRASSQRGELTIESPRQFDFRIVSARHHSIPIEPPSWDRYQNIRAAFRYDPQEEFRRSQYTPLLLQKKSTSEQVDTAWIWSLRLDSQYEPGGIVRNKALFLVENQGKDVLRIKLPPGIDATDVSSIWRDSQQIPWQNEADRRSIAVTLPMGQRFVSIMVEYTYRDTPLVRQQKLRPRYPSADIPILAGNWISWFPPEFDVSLRQASPDTTKNVPLSKALDYLLASTYRTYLGTKWDDAFYGGQRRLETEAAAQYFFEEIVNASHEHPFSTWEDLIGSEQVLAAIRSRLRNTSQQDVETKLFIDKQALAFLGITPATPIENMGLITKENVREKLFERAGLVLLIAIRTRADGVKEYDFALSTPITLSLNLQIHPIPSGHCVRIVPFELFDTASSSSSNLPLVLSPRWLSETSLSSIPWSVSAQIMPWTALTSDWNAYELPINTEQPLYIVHRQTFLALQWIAFLTLVLITCRKPFSSPIILFALLIVFELIARSVASCYVGIPSGAFLGVLVSIGFVLIRSHITLNFSPPERPRRDDSTECSASFVPTPLLSRCFLIGTLLTVLAGMCVPAKAQTLLETVQTTRKEPYPVFYPTDSEGQVIGNDVWVPMEFVEFLNRNTKFDNPAVSQRWNIVRAVYQGSLVRGTSGRIECSGDFKVVYEINLDSPSAVLALPYLPAVQGKFYWDSQPIWKDESKEDTLTFLIENETPGKHTLEIALSPKLVMQNEGDRYQIAFTIPKVPDSTLRLNVPPDMPPVSVPDALGAVTANSAVLTAELGATSKLSLSWVDTPSRNGTSLSEVEQYFWIRAKPLQIELNALFRYRIDEKIRQLTIQIDPHWQRSGPFSFDEQHPFTLRTETNIPLQAHSEQSPDNPYEVAYIDFQSPVSGTLTLRMNFVLRDFLGASKVREYFGAGNLRIPECKALGSRIAKSMLAVSAEPTLEVNFPAKGRNSSFESGWYGTSAITPPILGEFWGFASPLLTRRSENSPDVAYDLFETESAWTLNLRSKKIVPKVTVSQSVQFDTGESRVHVVGEFMTDSNVSVFQQYFSADRPIQIETVEVRDSQNDLVDARLQQIASKTMSDQYIIFFRRPVTGKYTITVQGFLETDMQKELSQQSVPALTFDEAQTTVHLFHFFRTSAVIADISPDQSGWTKSSAIPTAPESFVKPIPLGTWQRASATGQIAPESGEMSEPLRFALTPNRPKIQCKTVLALQTDPDEHWTMTLDFTGNISSGELKSLSFNWDERCGNIQPIEPASAWTTEQSGKILTFAPAEPMRGEQHFKITVPLNTTGAVSLPNVFPLAKEIDQMESEIFVDLPYKQGNEIIPWELNLLEAVEQYVARDGLVESQRLVYTAIDSDFSATISHVEARLTATFYDIGFLIRRHGMMTGIATIDLRNRGQDYFMLHMPPDYELLQVSSAGLMLEIVRLDESNRWRVNIGTSDYPLRLNILFRTTLRHPIKQWNREQVVITLQIPVLEGVTVQDTIWTVAFEGNVPTLNVSPIREQNEDWGNFVPTSGTDVTLSLIGLNLIRGHNLLRVLNSLPVSVRQEEEMMRWYLYWLEEWNTVADKVDFQISHLPLTFQNFSPKIIARPVDPITEKEEVSGIVRPFLKTMSAKSWEALKKNKEQSVSEKLKTIPNTPSKQPVPILNSQVYWQGRISDEMQHLFGTEEGMLRAVQLTSIPSTGRWMIQFSEYIWLWVSLALLVPVGVLLSVRWVHLMELWLQFPHFWGVVVGVLLWTFLPESFVGIILIVLTLASFYRPAWTRRRHLSKPF